MKNKYILCKENSQYLSGSLIESSVLHLLIKILTNLEPLGSPQPPASRTEAATDRPCSPEITHDLDFELGSKHCAL